MNLSEFGHRYSAHSGILELMEDLGSAMTGAEDVLMMGGGNPSHIPEVQALFRQRMQDILADGNAFERLIGNYASPQGETGFLRSMAELLRRELGWSVSEKNIVVTNGSQTSFFYLFNMFAGRQLDGTHKKIMFPLAPEYIGYEDVGLTPDMFISVRPSIEILEQRMFKYRVDFNALQVGDEVAALCVSRPTNPTGNVLTDEEITHLRDIARARGIPLIIDNAYGTPFPDIIFSKATPVWDEEMIVCASLSKLGLPGTRNGIVIASEEVCRVLSGMNAIISLANNGLGGALVKDMLDSGDILRISRDCIKPFYQNKAFQALDWLASELEGCDYYIHKPEGAIFLWLWFKGLPVDSEALYHRLKQRGVLVVPGHYFFPGMQEEWRHSRECLRITYSQDEAVVRRGIAIIAEEVKRAYEEKSG